MIDIEKSHKKIAKELDKIFFSWIKTDCDDYKKRIKWYKKRESVLRFKKRIEKLVNYLLYKL